MKTKFVKKCIVVLLGIIMIIVFIFLNYNTKDIVSIKGNSIKAINTQLNVNTDNNILYDYIRIWENSDLYRYYKGMSSTSAYVKNNHYLTIKIYTNVYIMYGLGIEFNENEFVEFGVSKSQLDKYTEGNMEFTELTPQQLEVLFERTVDNFKKETKEYISSDILAELNDNQINALTAIKYEWGNIGNFNDVYHLYKDGKIDEFKSSFHADNSSRPLFITGDGWPARADANWRVFSEGYYAREGEGIVLGKSQDNGILYKIIDEENKYVEVSKYTGTEENILLDETIIINNETYAVTKIGNNAFENNTTIKAVKCPQNTLVEIGERAFKGCTSLKDFAYVDNVTTIGKEAFAGDIVLAGELPFNNVTSIGEEAFKGCSSITSIEFGEVTEIKNSTFENCSSLKAIVLGNVTTIGEEVFKGCSKLELIRVPATTVVPENITDNENTVIGYVYNNVTYKINDDGETVTTLDNQEGELPETVIINDKTYYVVTEDTQELILITCSVSPSTGVAKEKATLNIEVTAQNTELKSITLNDESIELTDGTATREIRNNGEYTIKAISTSDKEYTKKVTISNIIKLKEIRVKNPNEVKIDYIEGQNFDRTGLKVEAVYVIDSTEQITNETTDQTTDETTDESTDEIIEEITDYTITDGNNLTVGKETVEISYTDSETGVTKTTTLPITVVAKELSSIAITNEPTKKSYIEGENFDKTGMVVTASYNDGTSKQVTNYTVADGNSLTAGKTSVTISYTENGITKTSEIEGITVTKKVEELHAEFEGFEEKEEGNIKYIEKIMPETKIETLKSKITTNGKIIEIYNNKNEKITNENEFIATGMEIVIKLGEQEQRYIVVVIGDLNSDGKIGVGDLLRLSRYEAKIDTNLTGAYLRASDVAGKGKYGGIGNITKMSRIIAKIDNL